MKNTFKKFFIFKYTECDAFKEYLEEMALKGWVLKDINTYLTFERSEPEQLIYSVEVFEKASVYDTRLEDNAKEYVDYCLEAGWKFICSVGKIHVFVAIDENAVAIETDETIKYQTIKKSMLKQNAFQWVVLPVILTFNTVTQYLGNFEFFITNYMTIFTAFIVALYYIITGSQIISFSIWCKRAKQNLEKGQKLPSFNQKDLKKRNIIRMIPFIVSLAALIGMGGLSFLNADYYSGWFMFVIMGSIILITGVSTWFQRSKLSREANIGFQIILGVGAAGFIMILCVALVIGFSHENAKVLVSGTTLSIVGRSEIPLTLEDTGIRLQKYRDTDKDVQRTVFAKCTSYYDTTSEQLSGEQAGITYSVFESPYKFIVDKYVRSKTSGRFNKLYKQGDASQWGANRVFIHAEESYYNIVVVYDDYVFLYRSDKQLTEAMIGTIREKLHLK